MKPVTPASETANTTNPVEDPIDYYVFSLASELLKITLSARQGKNIPTAALDCYRMANALVTLVREGEPQVETVVESTGRNLSPENLAALDWDRDEE